MFPNREIDFVINLVPETSPILKALYHMGEENSKSLKPNNRNF